MQTLYQYFIRQVKQQEIESYNLRHRDYMIRSGKLVESNVPARPNPKRATNQNSSQNADNTDRRSALNSAIGASEQVMDTEAKPRRQREFNRPTKNNSTSLAAPEAVVKGQLVTMPRTKDKPNDEQPSRAKQQQFPPQRPINTDHRMSEPDSGSNVGQSQERAIGKPSRVQAVQMEMKEYEEVELVSCEDCGRKFRPDALQKHMKVCQKVFQEKRKPFEAKKADQEAQLLKKKASSTSEAEDKKSEKWKKQSENFRNAMKRARGQKVDVVEQDDRIGCPTCGRKFNEKAASRHIEFCGRKNRK